MVPCILYVFIHLTDLNSHILAQPKISGWQFFDAFINCDSHVLTDMRTEPSIFCWQMGMPDEGRACAWWQGLFDHLGLGVAPCSCTRTDKAEKQIIMSFDKVGLFHSFSFGFCKQCMHKPPQSNTKKRLRQNSQPRLLSRCSVPWYLSFISDITRF